jgi:acyl transferase domain-containing protein/acyl carrier protein
MSATDKFPSHAVAIVGLAGRFPGARDLEGFWDNLKQGVESLEPFSDADLDASGIAPGLRSNPNYVRSGTVLEGADLFDAAFFGLSPREAQIIDPQQRIFLECAWEALEHAGYAPGTFEQAVGVYGGATMNTYLISQILRDPALVAAVGGYQLMLGNDKDFLCTRVSYKLDLHGPSMTIQTACSTSLVAVQVACRALERHECDIALAGGVSVSFPQRGGYLYQEGMILSPDGRCRPFDTDARGTRPGAGCGIVVLKRLAEALADGDTIHAVIRGAAINNDGAGKAGFTAPSVDGQVEAIATAQMLAGVDPRSIGYIEAHGTGTPLGDPIEIAALTQVFRAATPDLGFCRLGSLKGNLGHLDAAAGVAGLIKAVLALQHREIPPLLHFTQPNPQLDLEHSPFAASAAGSPWPAGATPRRAGVSSFGIGGTNAHVVIEEAPPVEAGPPARDAQLLVLSARSEEALDAATQRLVAHLETHPEQALADVAWTLQIGRRAFAHRRTVVVHGAAQAIERLGQPQRAPVHSAVHEGGDRPVAFLFSGQGSQHAGMGAGLYRSEPAYRDAIDRCAALLREPLGLDLRDVLFAPAGDGAINQTRLAQPALFATSYALAMLWQQWGLRPAAMLGHSIGEYVAAHLAGVMSLDDALSLVAARGQLMQAMPPGGMAAVHLGADELMPWLAASAGVEIAAVNAPGLCTIAGPADALAGCLARLQAGGIETRALHTSHAFHSAMMAPVLAPFTALVDKVALSAPTIPYVSNVTGQWITPQQATSPAYYAEHLRSPVMFAQGLRTLAADPGLHLLEVGPGNVLASLARLGLLKDGPGRVGASLGAVRDDSGECPAMLEALARLWRAGVPLDWAGTRGDTRPRRVPLPTYPFERKRHWVEARNEVPAEPARPAARTPRAEPVAERGVDDFFWEPTWQRSLKLSQLHPSPGQAPGRWLVFHDGSATAQAVVEALQAQGTDVTAVLPAAAFEQAAPDRFGIVPDRAEDYERLLDAVVGADDRLDCIAHLWNVSAPVDGVDALADAASGRAMGFYSLLYLAQALGRRTRSSPLPVLAVTSDRESVLGVEPVRPGRSLLVGPAYLMPIDVPSLHCRTIDLWGQEWQPSSAAGLATCLRAEAGRSGSEPVVAYRGAYRWAPLLRPRTLKTHDDVLPLRQGGTYLVTGGTGGIGLTLASYLATTWRARLVLTSRSALPERGEWERLIADERTEPALKARLRGVQQIEALGTEVMLCVADVCDEARMAAAVQSATARFGAIHGVVHAAGLLGAGTMLEKSASGIEAVLRPKVEGTLVLDRVLAGQGLDFLLLCSSISTAFGSTGMGDYSAANAFQDAFAKSGLARSTNRVISVGWDAWREVGFAASLGDGSAHAALRHAIRPQEGVEAMRRILASELPHVYVTSQDMPEMLRNVEALAQWMRDAGQRAVVDANPAQPRPMATTPVAGASDIEGRIAAIWTELLGVEDIDPAADFFELGGHSLLATRVLTRIEESTHVRLTLRDIFDAPTLRMLAERVSHAAEAHEDREEIEF